MRLPFGHQTEKGDFNSHLYMESLSGHRSSSPQISRSSCGGFIEEEENEDEVEAVIIGGMVLDINATPSVSALSRTTTPGKVRYALGGVARNVAECVSKLGTRPYMISALGFDMAGNLLLEYWESNGLSIQGIQRRDDIETPVVCNIFDSKGELAAGVASVESIERFLTPVWIIQFIRNIRSAPIMMIDANLNPPSLEASCEMAAAHDTPVWFEPVSVSKSRRVASVAKYITFASPNEDELIAMANSLSGTEYFSPIKISNTETTGSLFKILKPPISVLLESGIKIVAVTLGSQGVFLCSKSGVSFKKVHLNEKKPYELSRTLYKNVASVCPEDRFSSGPKTGPIAVHFPAIPASVVRLTGAGDCFVGGTLASLCAGLNIFQSVAVGIAAAKCSVETESNVPLDFCLTKLADDARSVYFGAKAVICQSML